MAIAEQLPERSGARNPNTYNYRVLARYARFLGTYPSLSEEDRAELFDIAICKTGGSSGPLDYDFFKINPNKRREFRRAVGIIFEYTSPLPDDIFLFTPSALNVLEGRRKESFTMYGKGLSLEDISRSLGFSPKTIQLDILAAREAFDTEVKHYGFMRTNSFGPEFADRFKRGVYRRVEFAGESYTTDEGMVNERFRQRVRTTSQFKPVLARLEMGFTNQRIMKELGLSERGLRTVLEKLKRHGLVTAEGVHQGKSSPVESWREMLLSLDLTSD